MMSWIAEPSGKVRAVRRVLATLLAVALLASASAAVVARWRADDSPAAATAAETWRADEAARRTGRSGRANEAANRARGRRADRSGRAGKRGRPRDRDRAAPGRWRPDVRAATRWVRSRAGTVSFAVRWGRRVAGHGLDRQYISASVIKAMLMTAYLRSAAVRSRPLNAGDRGLLAPMIRWSDNDAANTVRNIVGYDAIARLARTAGMRRFGTHPAWGLSLITARDQTRFFHALERLLPKRHRAYALGLLRTIVPEQRWGMARVIPKGWRLYFKGGWGVGVPMVDHQVGLLRRGRHRVSIAVLTAGSPSHTYAAATQEGAARRLLRGLEARVRGAVVRARSFLRPRQ
jgi:Beta-lactamase enzyme family